MDCEMEAGSLGKHKHTATECYPELLCRVALALFNPSLK